MQIATYIIQIILAVIVIATILLQAKGVGLGSMFGGDNSAMFSSRRGVEKVLFQATIVASVLFLIVSLLSATLANA
jgi:preprotein translocase subunit SecG